MSFESLLSVLLCIYPSGIVGSYGNYIFEEPPHCFPQWLHHFTFLPAVNSRFQFLHILSKTFNSYYWLFFFLITAILMDWASLVAQMVKNLFAMRETQVWSLGREGPLEKGMVTHSSILAWKIAWTEEPAGLQSMGSERVRQTEWLTFHSFHSHGSEVVSNCAFDLHFPNNWCCGASFMCLLLMCRSVLEKSLLRSFCPLLSC